MNRQSLVSTLEFVSRALGDDNLVQVFQCLCFTGDTVYATNDELTITAPCKVETKTGFGVHGKTLLGLLSNTKVEEVDFQLAGEEVTIKAGRSVFKLPYTPQENFLFEEPEIKKWGMTAEWTERAAKWIGACLTSSGRDTARPAFMGVCLSKGALYATDGDAITRCEAWLGHKGLGPVMLSNGFCETLLKASETYDKADKLGLTDEWAKASISKYTIYGRMRVIDTQLDHQAEMNNMVKYQDMKFVPVPKDLDKALARARVIADSESAKTTLSVESNRLKLHTKNHLGEVKDNISMPEHRAVQADVSAEHVQRSTALCNEFAITDRCTVYRNTDEGILVVLANLG